MVDFELSEQQQMLKKTVKEFAKNEIAPIAKEIDKSGEFPWDCVRKMAELGSFGIMVPPPFGGTGPDKLGLMVAMEEISAASASVAMSLLFSSVASFLILALGSDEQKARYLPALARGERLGTVAITEPGGGTNWPFTLQTTARLDNGSYVLNGTKCFISNGGEAEIYLILARTAPEKGPMGISGLIVEKGTPGFSFGKKEEKLGLRGDVTRELVFEDCRVPAANLLSESITMPLGGIMITIALPAVGAAAVGVARAALEAATEYVKQRAVAFGQMMANFDGVQCMIADMATMVEAARLLVYRAGSMPPNAPDITPGLMASVFPCETAIEVTSKALQLLGTYGYTADFPLERYFRDARGLTLVGQPTEARRLTAGRLKLGLPPVVPPGGAPPKPGGPQPGR
jgi:butyryl-CoA dehydrogenase